MPWLPEERWMAKTAAASRQPNQKSCYQRPHPLEEDLAWHLDGKGDGWRERERVRERFLDMNNYLFNHLPAIAAALSNAL